MEPVAELMKRLLISIAFKTNTKNESFYRLQYLLDKNVITPQEFLELQDMI